MLVDVAALVVVVVSLLCGGSRSGNTNFYEADQASHTLSVRVRKSFSKSKAPGAPCLAEPASWRLLRDCKGQG